MTVRRRPPVSFDDSITDASTAVTMPPEIYTSEEFLAFERDAVFAARVAVRRPRQPHPGRRRLLHDHRQRRADHRRRGKDGSVRAFSAVCQHRGMQVADDAGNCTKFTCPYHQWSYDLTGRLLGAPAMERTEAFDKKDYPLPRAGGRAVAGLRLRPLRRRRARRWRRRWPATSRTSRTTTSTTPSAPARSRSPTCRGTGR